MAGISNEEIVKYFEKITDVDFKKNFIGVFPSNYITKFISFHEMMLDEKKKYPFIIMNTDRNNRKGEHWWNFLDLLKKKEIFLFDSFGFEGFKEFVLSDDKNILNKILYGLEKFKKKDSKITIISLKFSIPEYEKIKDGHRLTPTAQDLLHLMYEFGRLHKIKNEIKVFAVDDQLQELDSDTCGIFQLYFYTNLFTPLEGSKIINDKKLSKTTIEKLLNEIFSLNKRENEKLVEEFAEENNISRQ